MKILIIAFEMNTLTGSPMYNYTLAVELKAQGHEVNLYAKFSNNETYRKLLQAGIVPIEKVDSTKHYDLTLISQNLNQHLLKDIKSNKIINIIHSEYDVESPIESSIIDKYVAIRPSIKNHLIKEHNIEEQKVEVIYNGVDLERFNPTKKKKHAGDYVKVVLPCTIHDLRIPFIEYYTNQASEKYRVYIYGQLYRNLVTPEQINKLLRNKWVFIEDPKFDIENYIADADLVAGILLGRVNLEATAMGIPNYVHNPLNPSDFYKFELDEEEFKKRHDIKNVADSILKLCESTITCSTVGEEAREVFTKYYKVNHWGDDESVSGTGSNLQQTKTLMNELPNLLKQFNIKSMLDIPCGDFYWMQKTNLSGVKYIGADIVDDLVGWCKEKYPSINFKVLNIIDSKLPKVDLVFSRDCLVHLPYSEIKKALRNIKESGAKYILTTSFPEHNNFDIKIGEWRPLNLQKEPFNLPEPIFVINENCTENNGIYKDKSMCLWKLENINQ